MVLQISFKHMTPKESLKEFIEEKSRVLKKYFDGEIAVTWTLGLENQDKTAHCHLVGNHMNYFGEAATEDFKMSIDAALGKIEKQMKKHKEIVKNHKNSPRITVSE